MGLSNLLVIFIALLSFVIIGALVYPVDIFLQLWMRQIDGAPPEIINAVSWGLDGINFIIPFMVSFTITQAFQRRRQRHA